MNKSISEELDNVLVPALWAFRAYGNQNGFKDHNKYAEEEIEKIKSFLRSKLLEVSESIVPERATERNTNKVSDTWELHGEAEVNGWNACVSQIADNIEKLNT